MAVVAEKEPEAVEMQKVAEASDAPRTNVAAASSTPETAVEEAKIVQSEEAVAAVKEAKTVQSDEVAEAKHPQEPADSAEAKKPKTAKKPEMCLNEKAVQMCILSRPRYLFKCIHMLIQMPASHKEAAVRKFAKMDDLSMKCAQSLLRVLDFLCDEASDDYILELESCLNRRVTECLHDFEQATHCWSTSWAKVLSVTVSRLQNKADADYDAESMMKVLPAIKAVLKATVPLPDRGADGKEGQEAASSNVDPATGGANATDQPPSLQSIYDIDAVGSSGTTVLDIMSIQSQVEAHLMLWAGQKSSAELLRIMVADQKSNVMIKMQNLEPTLGGAKIFAFGRVSTERSVKSVKVASATFGTLDIDFWMSGDGYNRATSLCPCAVWLVKPGYDLKRAMFDCIYDEDVIEFPDSPEAQTLDLTHVHMRYHYIELRTQAGTAIETLVQKGTDPDTSLLCTRAWMAHEKDPKHKLGGGSNPPWKKVASPDEPMKAEPSADEKLLMDINAPRHCAHLLK
ncbi:unnamed protein product [Symbiodinium sp. CCMP2592]|nr:unnamed protein product [Symbiodinium sp. CCMP2592]